MKTVWEIASVASHDAEGVKKLQLDGWEPFAVHVQPIPHHIDINQVQMVPMIWFRKSNEEAEESRIL